jgi:hypothetical protein
MARSGRSGNAVREGAKVPSKVRLVGVSVCGRDIGHVEAFGVLRILQVIQY